MSKKTKIILAIIGGSIVGGLGVCSAIWAANALIFATASALVAMVIATITGISITKEVK